MAEDYYRIHVTVIDANGNKVSNAEVSVWQQRIREPREIECEDVSEEDGTYHVRYRPPHDAPGKLLIVAEARSHRLDQPLVSRPMLAQPDIQIDLRAQPRDPSEFGTLMSMIRPLLEKLALTDLLENDQRHDISFLSQETGKSTEQIMLVVVAARLEAAFGIAAEAFYAFLRQRIPPSIPSPLLDASHGFAQINPLVRQIGSLIFALTPEVASHTLETAAKENLVGSHLTSQIQDVVGRFQTHRSNDLLVQPYLTGPATLGQLLDTAELPKPKQTIFAQVLAGNQDTMQRFWETLGDGQHGLTAAEVSSVRQTLDLGALVQNHLPLLQTLLDRFKAGTHTSLADLARLRLADWVQAVNQAGAPPQNSGESSKDAFATAIYRRATRMFPTVALASRVSSEKFIPEGMRTAVDQFFRNNAGLDLEKTNLTPYLSQQKDKAFLGIAKNDQPAVIAQVKRLQRVLRIVPEVDLAQTLLRLDLHSATQIANMGRQQFLTKAIGAGLTKGDADRTYEVSAQRYAELITLFTQYNLGMNGVLPRAVGSTLDIGRLADTTIQREQSLATLFGSQDYCAVDDCTSILSPAAYLCDLLLWLRNHALLMGRFPAHRTVLDVLLDSERRPDLAGLKLNCPNTNTRLPYIDLVNELLEDAVNPPPIQRQTTKSAAELRAAPEPANVNTGAYNTLSNAKYPFTLPYNTWLDELRGFLQQSEIPLWQLRQELLLPGREGPVPVGVAAERFGIDSVELTLITMYSEDVTVLWNTSASQLTKVPDFLRAASITYEQLLELLDVDWVTRGKILLTGRDDTCDTSVQTLEGLDLEILDRMHRFLRLWRHCGWKMWELKLLLTGGLGIPFRLDEDRLVALYEFRALQDVTGLPVDQQLAFFLPIDTNRHRDPDGTIVASLFTRLFVDPVTPPDPDLVAIAGGEPVAGPAPPLSDSSSPVRNSVRAALQLSNPEATNLSQLLRDPAVLLLNDDLLTLPNLSVLYRVLTLSRVVGLSFQDLKRIVPLTQGGSLREVFTYTEKALAFIRQVKTIQNSGLILEQVIYILTAQQTAVSITDDQIATILTGVRALGNVIQAVTASLVTPADGLPAAVVSYLASTLQVPGSTATILGTLSTMGAGDINRGAFPQQYLAIQILHKAGTVVNGLDLSRASQEELSWLLGVKANIIGGLDLMQLPMSGPSTLKVESLLTTSRLIQLNRAFGAAPPQNLYSLIWAVHVSAVAPVPGSDNVQNAQNMLAAITGWRAEDIKQLAMAMGLSYPNDYVKPATYEALRKLEAMMDATGANGQQLASWAAETPDTGTSQSIRQTLRSRYSPDAWLNVLRKMMDPIRERRSAALRDFLAAEKDESGKWKYGDSNGLFEHFLIDVQMSSCELTTRVVQAYAAVQLFVERCFLGLEDSNVVAALANDDSRNDWKWMKRYRIWEANRKVFLYPENWLIEAQRPNRTEIFQKLEQEVHQNESTIEHLEKVALNYIDRLDELSQLQVTGTCQDPGDPSLGRPETIHVVARTLADPPRFYHRSFDTATWTSWQQIQLGIHARQVIPAVYRGRLFLFWPDVKVANEPHQHLPAVQPSATPPSQEVARYVSIGLNFSVLRNGTWAPAQTAKGKLFDIPLLNSQSVSDSKSVESIYTLKVRRTAVDAAAMYIDVFRLGKYDRTIFAVSVDGGPSEIASTITYANPSTAVHLGTALFDGRFTDLKLRDLAIIYNGRVDFDTPPSEMTSLLTHALRVYGPDAQTLLHLTDLMPDLSPEPGLVQQAGAFVSSPARLTGPTSIPLTFNLIGPLLSLAGVPFRVIGPDTNLGLLSFYPNFNPFFYFFYQDVRRCYYVESQFAVEGHPFELLYHFHRFYHPYTSLFWSQISWSGFRGLYARQLQLQPHSFDRNFPNNFSFSETYQPVSLRVDWSQGQEGREDRDKEIIDFSSSAAYSAYNWELFFHTPLYIAERLSQNQKFEDAIKWFHFIFDPSQQGVPTMGPQRFWIPKPLNQLSTVYEERINNLLSNLGNPAVSNQVNSWRKDPFNPFLLADLRQTAYMKRVVMSYLDTLVAWADNLYRGDSREGLNQATLLYVRAAEILGPQPVPITPPPRADESFNDLQDKLDAFANAFVDIENTMGSSTVASGGGGGGTGMPSHTLYFKIPPNDKLLVYWKTIADRLFKLRHCENIQGVTRELALFDAPLDPGLLIRAQAAGIDIGSVLTEEPGALSNYRFTALYPRALDFVNAVRGYGDSLLAALEKSDASELSVLLTTSRQQLLADADQVFGWRIEKAQAKIEALNRAIALQQARYENYYNQAWASPEEHAYFAVKGTAVTFYSIASALMATARATYLLPVATGGTTGVGGTPVATLSDTRYGDSWTAAADGFTNVGDATDKTGDVLQAVSDFNSRKDDAKQKAAEATIEIQRLNAQLAGAQLALQIAQQEQASHAEQVTSNQQQVDFLTNKFTNVDLYDWMVGQLADTYFQSYRLAYRMCKQVERGYQYQLGIPDSSFIKFGYWDSLKKGLLAAEALSFDLRRMQGDYLEQNKRRFEISRYISLAALDPPALLTLKETGSCDFHLRESLFDHDYPGHYQRRLVRVSVSVLYPNPGKFDNVKGTLTLVWNTVRVSTDFGSGYPRKEGVGVVDARFKDDYAAAPQKIVLSNAQDDAGMFVTAIDSNLRDERYLPFEGAGAISSWQLEIPKESNEIDFSSIGDVVLHVHYTAADGGGAFQDNAKNAQTPPTTGLKLLSIGKDFAPANPLQSFLAAPSDGSDQTLTVSLSQSMFPAWTRGRNITVTSLRIFVVSWNGGNFVLAPKAPLPTADVRLPVTNVTKPNFASGDVAVFASAPFGDWKFNLRTEEAADFRSMTSADIVDVLLLVGFRVA